MKAVNYGMLHSPCKALALLAAFATAVCMTGCGGDAYTVPDNIVLAGSAPQPETTELPAETTEPVTSLLTELTGLPETTATETVTEAVTEPATEAPAATTAPSADTPASPEQTPDENGLTPEDYAFLSQTVFVGDSICSGLRVYNVLDAAHVLAQGSVGARNIMEYTFDLYGTEVALTYGLSTLQPKYVIFSMGMNDINMTDPAVYCQNYDALLATVHSVLPDAVLYVASITPIGAESDFSTNDKIDLYNATIRDHLAGTGYGYVDIASGMKATGVNALDPAYSGGDGIHLMPAAYYVYLQQVCRELVRSKAVGGVAANGIAYGSART